MRLPMTAPTKVLAILMLISVAACSDDPTSPDAGDPPELPPLTTMTGDFSFFGSPSQSASPSALEAGASNANFANAALRVFAAQVVTTATLAVPVAVFAATANNTPTFEDDDLWHWRFTAMHAGETYMSHLSGRIQGNDVVWSMAVTSPTHDPPLDEFTWYGGVGRVDRSSGTWTFYDPSSPSTATEVLTIEWTHVSATDHGWQATVERGEGSGDVLSATVDGSNRLLTFQDASEGTFVEIYWNAADGSGYLIAPGYNGGVQACWDTNQEDAACA